MSKSTAVRVLDNVDLELPPPPVQLSGQRRMAILERFVFARIVVASELCLARRKAEVVAVMRADYLDLVQVNLGVLIGHRLGQQHIRTAEDEQRGDAHGSLQSKLLFACSSADGRRGEFVVPRLPPT